MSTAKPSPPHLPGLCFPPLPRTCSHQSQRDFVSAPSPLGNVQELADKVTALNDAAGQFEKSAVGLKRNMRCRNWKVRDRGPWWALARMQHVPRLVSGDPWPLTHPRHPHPATRTADDGPHRRSYPYRARHPHRHHRQRCEEQEVGCTCWPRSSSVCLHSAANVLS
jgi:hypothetical protein